MFSKEKAIDVVGADRLSNGLLIHFSNNTSTLFHSQFLYDVRNQDHNVPIVEEDDVVSES